MFGDVVCIVEGLSVEIVNIDVEGCLVLSDVMWYVCDKFKLSIMIDVVILIGLKIGVVGNEYVVVFFDDD